MVMFSAIGARGGVVILLRYKLVKAKIQPKKRLGTGFPGQFRVRALGPGGDPLAPPDDPRSKTCGSGSICA
jgi:hypothetical protein